MWIDFAKGTINSHWIDIYLSVFGLAPVPTEKFNNAVKELKEAINTLNTHLEGKTFLVSDRVTVADLVIGLTLVPMYQTVLDSGFRKAMPHATLWIEKLISLPEVAARIGNVKFTVKGLKSSSKDNEGKNTDKEKIPNIKQTHVIEDKIPPKINEIIEEELKEIEVVPVRYVTLTDLKNKRRELQLLCRVKTCQKQMLAIRDQFLAQQNLSNEELIEADL